MDLLGRARGFFRGLSAPAVDRVQYFSVVCPEGHRVRGQRTEGYQAIRCPACGEGVFVLPSSPLPEPEPPQRRAPRRPAARQPIMDDAPLELKDPAEVTVDVADPDDRAADAEIIWDDEDEAEAPEAASRHPLEPPQPAKSPRTRPADGRPEKKPRPKSPRPAEPVVRTEERTARPRPQPAERAAARERPERIADRRATVPAGPERPTRRLSRPAMIAVGLMVLVVASIGFRTWRAGRRQLPEVAALGRTEGIPALEAGKFDKAYQILSAARDAVDSLGGDVEGAEQIRHAADEAGIFVDLLSDSLETLLEEAARTKPQDWESRFNDIYKGRSVIIEATVVSTPDTPGGRYALDYLVLPPGEGAGERRFARLDVSDLQGLTLAKPKAGDRVIFGARLASFQYDTERESFVIRFDPKSAVAIGTTRALEVLGWPSGMAIPDESSVGADEP